MRYCQVCGMMVQGGARRCPLCGSTRMAEAKPFELGLRGALLHVCRERPAALRSYGQLHGLLLDLYPTVAEDAMLMAALQKALPCLRADVLSEERVRMTLGAGRHPFPQDVVDEVLRALVDVHAMAGNIDAYVRRMHEEASRRVLDPNEAYRQGVRLLKEEGAASHARALDLLRGAARQCHTDAMVALANRLMYRPRDSRDTAEGAYWYTNAASLGSPRGKFAVGVMALYGTFGVTRDGQRTMQLWREAADQGLGEAGYQLAGMYDHTIVTRLGLYVHPCSSNDLLGPSVLPALDLAEAARIYCRTAEQGHALAQFCAAECYAKGRGVRQDDEMAVRYYRMAADQGFASAQRTLGEFCQRGRGTRKDPSEAVRLFRLAADKNDADALCDLGECVLHGEGVAQDYGQAVDYLTWAANRGSARAKSQLGACYQHGWGVPKDMAQALVWYRLATQTNTPGLDGGLRRRREARRG